MTNIIIYKSKEGLITGIETEGHANNSIVCSSISTLLIHTINTIGRFTEVDIIDNNIFENQDLLDKAKFSAKFKGFLNCEKFKLLMESFYISLNGIDKKNPGNLKVRYEFNNN